MWTIDIIGAHSDQRQLEAAPVRADHHLRRRLAGRVGIGRRKYACLAQICCAHRHIAIHLVCGDVYEPIDAVLPRSFKQNMCAVHIGVCELVRVTKAQVDVRLRREVEDGVDLVLAKHSLDVAWRCDVAVFEGKVRSVVEHARVVQGRAVVELVEGDHIVVWIGEHEMAHEPARSVSRQRLGAIVAPAAEPLAARHGPYCSHT